MGALVVVSGEGALAEASAGGGTVVLPPSVPVSVSVPLGSRGVADGVRVPWHATEGGGGRRRVVHKSRGVLLTA